MSDLTDGESQVSADGGIPDRCPHCGDTRLIHRRHVKQVYRDATDELLRAVKVAEMKGAPWVCPNCCSSVDRQ